MYPSTKLHLGKHSLQPVHSEGDQPWMFFGRNDAKAETPVLWPPHAMSWLIGKDPNAGKDWGQEEKGMIEDEMVGWHHQLNGHGFGWTSGVGDGQGGLACCSSWGCKESYMTERLNWTENDNPHQSRKRGLTQVFHIADGFFTSWATSEAQEYWSGLPIPSPMDLPDLGVKLGFPELQVDYLPNELWGKII